jgi:hypothetical protein
MRTVLLVLHIAAGTAGLLLVVPVLFVPKRRGWHPWLGRSYLGCTALLCLSAYGLVVYDPARLWPFVLIGTGTLACAAGGLWFALRRPRGWTAPHLSLMSSSAISFVTAFALQMTHFNPLAWILPTVIGTPLIARRTAREARAWQVAARGELPGPDPLAVTKR